MSVANQLIDPRLMASLGAFYPSRCAIEPLSADAGSDDETSPAFEPDVLLTAIPCEVAPAGSSPGAPFDPFASGPRYIALARCCPTIRNGMRAAVTRFDIDPAGSLVEIYEITDVEHAAQLTRLTGKKLN